MRFMTPWMKVGCKIRGVFLNISKVFDKVWHAGLIFKSKQNGISGNSLNVLEDLRRNREQRVVLNDQTFNWEKNCAGVPQSSLLGLLYY